MTIVASVPCDLAMVVTCVPQTPPQTCHEHGKRERKEEKRIRTDPHALKQDVIVRASAYGDYRVRLQEVDATHRGITGLQTAEERSIHGVDITEVEILGCLLGRALRLPRVIVLSGSHH
jgi:hypothetical protein